MNYADDISTNPLFSDDFKEKRLGTIKVFQDRIAHLELELEKVKSAFIGMCKKEEELNRVTQEKGYAEDELFKRCLAFLTQVKELCNLHGCFVLVNMEFVSALINILRSETDWEYRVSARRAYTLMYESHHKAVSQLLGSRWKILIPLLSEGDLTSAKQTKQEFEAIFGDKTYEFFLDQIRN